MACKHCGGGLVLRGTMARGRYACQNCDPEPVTGGTKILQRYHAEVHGWHRSWCAALQHRGAGRTDPKLCDCGHDGKCPSTSQQIEQRERAAYGEAP
jgi:hypothetical protein